MLMEESLGAQRTVGCLAVHPQPGIPQAEEMSHREGVRAGTFQTDS